MNKHKTKNNQTSESINAVKLADIPLRFYKKDNAVDDKPYALDDNQYKFRMVNHTSRLKHLLNTPPIMDELSTMDDIQHEIIDNYLWVVGELINGLYRMSHKYKKTPND